ncbi:MAG: hypothetical protein H0X39_19620 [Actinobacteria bacterium]|nr:hypothetical protein [Actinomycetota bacterium]
MSSTYTPNPANNPASITRASDGDPKPIASVNIGLEGIADKVANTQWPGTDGTKRYPYASRSPVVQVSCSPYPDSAASWTMGGTSGFRVFSLVTYQATMQYPISPPDGSTIQTLTAIVRGVAGHVALPATRPNVALVVYDSQTGATAAYSAGTDAPANVAAYEVAHSFMRTALGVVVDRSRYSYSIAVGSEGGANALAGMAIYGVSYVADITSQDPGGC